MKGLLGTFLAVVLLTLLAWPCSAGPVVLGLANKHPLSEAQQGEVLLGELRCLACHSRAGALAPLERLAPDLADVGARIAPDYLRRFIASPSASHSGTTMPDLLAAETVDQRNKIAEAITHFLVAGSRGKYQYEALGDPAEGKALFHSVGCVACHSPRDAADQEVMRDGVVELGHLAAKYSPGSLSAFLFQPLSVRPAGRMPDMKLTRAEAKALASYLLRKADKQLPLQPRADLAALGKKYYQQLNCAACHKLGDISPAPLVGALQDANLERGCLAKLPGKAPHFHLSDGQVKALRLALAQRPAPVADKTALAMTLTTFNCIACHIRDNYGGVSEERNPYFQSNAKNLGDDARVPPPLTLVGAKLQPVWLKKVLFDAESVRPYMFTRMPQYGEANLRHLPDLFARLDKVEEVTFSLPNSESPKKQERDRAQAMREAGRKLLGNKSLNCVACHNFNGKTPQNHGIELMTTQQRLQPSWFYHFLCDPNAYRPRTVMPTAWLGKTGVDKSVFDGDTHRQIEAIWYFLSLGRSAPDPAGVENVETKLFVTEAARTYRGRSSVAGYRGIAVGLPNQLSYAFNAETGTLTALWRGDFIRVDRGGQGSGAFHPASRHVAMAQDVSFYVLPDEQAPWPLRPVLTKAEPVNPDPLYPKNRGYQFKGYYLDDAAIPTFMYRCGALEIEDRSTAAAGSAKGQLLRTFTFNAPQAQTIWFRALTGKIEAEAPQRFKTAEVRLVVPPTPTLVRPTAADKTSTELLLKLAIPQGKSTLSFTYELLK